MLIQSMHIDKYVKCLNKATAILGLTLGFAYLMPHCWLEVSLHPEGPESGQLDQGFPWFSSGLEQMLSWYPNPTLMCKRSVFV
jgi:hypothetical protein